jgi:hypothetical protein
LDPDADPDRWSYGSLGATHGLSNPLLDPWVSDAMLPDDPRAWRIGLTDRLLLQGPVHYGRWFLVSNLAEAGGFVQSDLALLLPNLQYRLCPDHPR